MTNLQHDHPDVPLAPPAVAPVMQSICWVCGGRGWREYHVDELGGHGERCVWCSGTGFVWIEVPR